MSAQPTFGGTSRKVLISQAALPEESEPEDEMPVKKVSRKKLVRSVTFMLSDVYLNYEVLSRLQQERKLVVFHML